MLLNTYKHYYTDTLLIFTIFMPMSRRRPIYVCFNDISVNANPIYLRLKSKRQRINTVTFYLRDISTPLVGVFWKHIDQIQEPLIHKC